MSNESPTFTRRGVVRTAAWSVPAVTVATAAPAFASSDDVVRVSLVNQYWGVGSFLNPDTYLYVHLDVCNVSSSTTVLPATLTLTFTFGGQWTRGLPTGTLIDVDPGDGGLFPSWGDGWEDFGQTEQNLNGTATRAVANSSAILPNSCHALRFRVRRQVLTGRPYGESVGIVTAGLYPLTDDSLRVIVSPSN